MKYLICFLLCGLFGQAQELTKDYRSRTIPSKAVVASLYANWMGTDGDGNGIYVSLNTNKRTIPIIFGDNRLEWGDDASIILGAGYGKRYQYRKIYYSGQILPKIWFGRNAYSVEFDLGVSREYNNNLVLRVDIGSGLWYGDRVDYNSPPDPITFQYPVKSQLRPFTNLRLSMGYRF